MSLPLDPPTRPRVTVVGSLNVDHLWSVACLPRPGQTIRALTVRREFGGKGANQAVAAARQGAQVDMLGVVGGDADGKRYREHLEREGIDITDVLIDFEMPTGAAHVYVDDQGENMIIVNAGANGRLDATRVKSALSSRLTGTNMLLAQLECPVEAVEQALRLAHACGVRSILNAAPFVAGFAWTTPVDTVLVNEHECLDFFHRDPGALQELPVEARCDFLRRHRIRNLVVTQGSRPTVHLSAKTVTVVPTCRVEPKDTVGAGDTFAGTLAVRLAEGTGWEDALWSANVAAALSTLSPGAQSAMPTYEQVKEAGRAFPSDALT